MLIVHVITGLNNGGAEGVLYRLVTNDKMNTHHVISLQDEGVYGAKLRAKNIKLYTLNMPRSQVTLKGLCKLLSTIRSISPNIVQTWMYHADLLGGIAARCSGINAVAWGIRGAYNKDKTSVQSKIVIYLCAYLSRVIPKVIVNNSAHAKDDHIKVGYSARKMKVVRNGFSFVKFQPDDYARKRVNLELNLTPNTLLLGMIARYDVYKDHENLFIVLSRLIKVRQDFVCLLIGPGMEGSNQSLSKLIDKYKISNAIKLLGSRDDVPNLMAALDLHLLSSIGESFPNVLVEAMACGTPCVTTDVGDAALIVGETGWIVPSSNPDAFFEAILKAFDNMQNNMTWIKRKQACLTHVNSMFTLESMLMSFNNLWCDMLR